VHSFSRISEYTKANITSHRLKHCNRSAAEKQILMDQDEWAEPPDFEGRAASPDPWCNTQFCSFRESVGSLARSLRILSREFTDYYPDRLLSVEVFGLCERCSDRIEDCDKLFDELLGFKGGFVLYSKTPEGAAPPAQPRVRRYQHPLHIRNALLI
jgi:hypothetical protein